MMYVVLNSEREGGSRGGGHFKEKGGKGEVAQWVEVSVSKPGDLGLILEDEGQKWLL